MKKVSLSIFTLAACLFIGCSDKENVQEPVLSGDPVLATFRLSVPESYANGDDEVGSTEENKISMVEFYMFDATGQRDENTSAYNYSYHKYVGSGQSEISFLVKSGVSKRFLVAVNAELGEHSGKNYDAIEQLIADTKLSSSNSQLVGAGNFMMSGKQVSDIIENSTENEVAIRISRVLTKIEPPKKNDSFKVSIPDEDLQTIFADETVTKANIEFDLRGYVLINGYSDSYIYTYYNSDDKEYKVWDLWSPGGDYNKTTYDGNGQITQVYSGTQEDSFWLTSRNVFVYENQPEEIVDTESGITGYEKKQVYAFLIQGALINKADGNTELIRYWRVNLIRDDNYSIFRNTIYRVTLDEVKTVGYGTPKEAEEDEDGGKIVPKNDQTGIQATIDIVPWRVKLQNTDF